MTIIHIGRGFGFLVLVFFFGCLWETQSIMAEKFGQDYPFHHIWVMGVATLSSAPMCLLAGWFLYDRNAEVQTDPMTHKEVVIRSHTSPFTLTKGDFSSKLRLLLLGAYWFRPSRYARG